MKKQIDLLLEQNAPQLDLFMSSKDNNILYIGNHGRSHAINVEINFNDNVENHDYIYRGDALKNDLSKYKNVKELHVKVKYQSSLDLSKQLYESATLVSQGGHFVKFSYRNN